ncbi:MAG: DUF692 domain-containing protein [Gammaproteobacteria bacterium]|nr:DUF692 domain-containing protein [Gammaproteobacteria bacterium]
MRKDHFGHILENWPTVDWFEIVSENFMDTEGRPLYVLDQVAERYPIVMHGVSMSIGSTDPIDFDYLRKLKSLAERVDAVWLGDHVCWTGVAGLNGHDLYPIPYNEETLEFLVERIRIVQDFLERPLILENPSTYLTFASSTMPEQAFLARMSEDADCGLLLDVNNVYVTCRNHDLDPREYLEGIPYDRVVQIHLAGHTDKGTHCIDTHDGRVIEAVWELYSDALARAGATATLLEWDAKIPPFEEVHTEALKAAKFRNTAEAAYA